MRTGLALLLIFLICFMSNGREIRDMGAAREWCDNAMLQLIEGIWMFPDDETSVLIRKSAGQANMFDLVVIETPDTRLTPGEIIGNIKSTPLSTKFELNLFKNKTKGLLSDSEKCMAELNENEDALIISMPKKKFRFTPRMILPSFWNLIRLSFRIDDSNPVEKLPYGMVRIYPQFTPRQIDYL